MRRAFGWNVTWLRNGGNMGIGTVVPQYKLAVNGILEVLRILEECS